MTAVLEYTLVRETPRTVWRCDGCKRYRHRDEELSSSVDGMKHLLPAICCGKPARLVDRYSQPQEIVVEETI